ncbi:guanylate cyclase [Leptospira perolatii]|uniref:Guanylate cyclase n=1 Tax=Leptospira perolatii TaxID=2023191 RepID=A0A2M9ZM46_9LEPT|nr:adenylate/guanylate cyclase domain-containing protein [Leptospira perolatii]PJZ69721.1 guanylate cyclase [Leptospira perolatii]PJZ73064.1 guanylate cyclase [Leptospira perolatii]
MKWIGLITKFCKRATAVWRNLLNIGVVPGEEPRYIVATNAVVFVTSIFTVIYYILFTAVGLRFPGWMFILWGLNIACYSGVIWLNATHRHRYAPVLLAVAGWLQLLLISRILPTGAGLDLYIIASFFLPFYIFPAERKVAIALVEIALAILMALSQILRYFFEPILHLEGLLLDYFYFTSILLVIIWLSFLGNELSKSAWEAERRLKEEKEKADQLLLNILPKETADELKRHGISNPRLIKSATVLFTDFYGFTTIAEKLSPNELVQELDACFREFDSVTEQFGLEKLKTIGDAYMCAGGVPSYRGSHAVDSILAAMKIIRNLEKISGRTRTAKSHTWQVRIGIHSGPLVAGVIGARKFSYDVWGDTVNLASRLETASEPGKVNVSKDVVKLAEPFFRFRSRGKLPVKNKSNTQMYFLLGLKPGFHMQSDPWEPNENFWKEYRKQFAE